MMRNQIVFFAKLAILITAIIMEDSIGNAAVYEQCEALYKPGSYEESRRCYLNLANRKIDTAKATFALGAIYAEGKGVEPNLVEAYKWFIISKNYDGNNNICEAMINACERELSETEIKQGRALAKQWLRSEAIQIKTKPGSDNKKHSPLKEANQTASQNNIPQPSYKKTKATVQEIDTGASASGIIKWNNFLTKLSFHDITVLRTQKKDVDSDINKTTFSIIKYGENVTEIMNDGSDRAFIYRNFPANGYETLIAEVSSRGSGGYTDSIVLTYGSNFTYITTFNNLSTSFNVEQGNYLSTIDNHFSHYTIKADDKIVTFCSVCSPSPKRSVIFQGQTWRIDRPGENNSFYSKLALSTVEEYKKLTTKNSYDEIQVASTAITASYYYAMLNKSEAQLESVLNGLLPSSLKSAAKSIAHEISAATSANSTKLR